MQKVRVRTSTQVSAIPGKRPAHTPDTVSVPLDNSLDDEVKETHAWQSNNFTIWRKPEIGLQFHLSLPASGERFFHGRSPSRYPCCRAESVLGREPV